MASTWEHSLNISALSLALMLLSASKVTTVWLAGSSSGTYSVITDQEH